VLLQFCSAVHVQAVKPGKNLPPEYRHWIDVEVPYIISTQERKEFYALSTDEQRDKYIENFWRIRNPDQSSSFNSYKEEHYRRLAYANENFGVRGAEDGWRTDRGRMYIILGKPKQRAQYHESANVRPMEIWFYQAETPLLPPYFYLVFYKRSAAEDFTLYSPRNDGPVRLVSTGESRNDPVMALNIIKKSLGAEVATHAVTLLTNEHASLDSFEPSMESDALLNSISNLPDNPYTTAQLQANRTREHVTTSLFLGGTDATLSYTTFRDNRGRTTLSYLLGLKFPDARLVGTRTDGGNYYDLTLRTEVQTTEGKPVYQQEDRLTGDLTQAQAELARKKRFGAEARLPLVPGSYNLVATLTNNVNKLALRQRSLVVVPTPRAHGLAVSGLLAYMQPAAVPDPHSQMPFSGSHFRFTPLGAQNVYIHQGDNLPLVFQLWLEPQTGPTPTPEKIHIRYEFGSIAASHTEAQQENEDVEAANRDEAGNLLTGHSVNTSNLMPGVYQVVVTVTRASEPRPAYATLNLHVMPTEDYIETWTVHGPADPGGEAADDFKRGTAAEALGADEEAEAAYSLALAENPTELRSLDNLAALLGRKGMTAQLAALGTLPTLTKTAATPATLLAITDALNKSGNPKAIVRLLEAQLLLQAPRVDIYKVLADACEATGNMNRAKELRSLAQNLK
jgi:GWxTD domain-containing protein